MLEQVTEHTGKHIGKLAKNKWFLGAAGVVAVLGFVVMRKNSQSQDTGTVAMSEYPVAPQDPNAGIGQGAATPGITQDDLKSLYDAMQSQQGQALDYFNTQIQQQLESFKQQSVQTQQQQYVQQQPQPMVQQQPVVATNDPYAWTPNNDGSFTKSTGNGSSINFTPSGSTVSGSSGGSSSSKSGVYTPTGNGGSNFTPGKVTTSMPSTEGKAAVTQTKDGYSYGGKSYSSLGSALHAAGAKGW